MAAALCAAALLAAGCGSDDGGGDAEADQVTWSPASEPPTRFAERMAKLVATATSKADCPQLDAISERSYFRFTCPAGKALRRSMAGFEVVGSKGYGTGAVVDYKSGKLADGAAIVLFTAPDRNWALSRMGILTEPSTRTSDADSREGYQEAVESYLDAVRERDCARLREVTYTGGIKGGEVCKSVLANTEQLAKRLKASPDAEPDYLGGNATYGFYGIETPKPQPQNSTISVIKGTDDSYLVLDSAPSPTAAEQRRVRREYERQQKNKRDSTDPSTKPSDPAVTTP